MQTNGNISQNVVALVVSGPALFAGTWGNGIFLSTDNGANWTTVNSGLTVSFIRTLIVKDNNLFAGSDSGIFLSTNHGASWAPVNSGLTNSLIGTLAVNGNNLFASTDSGIFLSSNNGANWTAVKPGLSYHEVQAFAFSGNNMFAGTWGRGVFLSTNNGGNWISIDSGFTYLNCVQSLIASGNNLFAGTYEQGIFLSTNNGESWIEVDSGLAYPGGMLVTSFAVYGSNLFAGTDMGVFLSTNNGTNWTTIDSGLTNTWVSAIVVSGSNLFVGTAGAGVWRRPLTEMITSVEHTSSQLPKNYYLHQNFPNPVNPTTTISFFLPVQSFVTLKVFDMLGKEVSTIVSDELQPGTYNRQWDATNIASGVYFYRLQAGTFTETKKLLLLK